MHYTDVGEILGRVFQKLGYRECTPDNWVAETPELIIVLSYKVNDWEKDIYIDIGILFKKLYNGYAGKEPVLEDLDIGQGLYNILYDMGEWEYYLNNLFSYDPAINTDEEIKNNVSEIGMLFLTKVIPHIEQLDTYAWLVNDFEDQKAWIPFLQYFRPSEDNNHYFYGILELYYWKHRIKI